MFLKNKNIIFKIRRSKVTDYAALTYVLVLSLSVVLRKVSILTACVQVVNYLIRLRVGSC